MSKPKAPPPINPQPAIDAQLMAQRRALNYQRRYTPLKTDIDLGPFGGQYQAYDPKTKTVTSKTTLNPLIEEGLTQALNQNLNYDELLAGEKQQIEDVYQKPFAKQSEKFARDLFGELGPSGRYSSRGAKVVGDLTAAQDDQQAITKYELGRQAENDLINRLKTKFEMFYNPAMVATGMANPNATTATVAGAGQSGANVIAGTGRGIADTYNSTAQANYQGALQASQKPSIWSTLAGAATGSLFSLGSGIALKRF